MEQGTLLENAPRRRKLVLYSWVCNKRNGVVEVRTFSFISRCWVEIVINWQWIKLASLVLIWILWVVTLWRRILAILRIWEIWSMEDLCILRVVVPCKNRWPLEKIRILHWVDFEQNEYEFCLDMCDTPRVCGMKLETVSCLDQMWSRSQKRMLSWFKID